MTGVAMAYGHVNNAMTSIVCGLADAVARTLGGLYAFAEPVRRPVPPSPRPHGGAKGPGVTPRGALPPAPPGPPAEPEPSGHHWLPAAALGLAVLAAVLAITDVMLVVQWIRLGRRSAGTEQSVTDAQEDLAAIRSKIAAARARLPAPSAPAPSREPIEPPVVAAEVASRVADEAMDRVANDTPATTPDADDEPETAAAAAGTSSLEERIKVTEVQTRLDRILRATIEGHITLLKRVEDGELLQVQLAGAAEFLRLRVVADRPNAWRIEHVNPGRDDSPERVASIGLRGRSLVLGTSPSPRTELLRYIAIELQGSSPEDRATIPLGGPHRARFEPAAADPPRSATLRPPLEVSLFRDRTAGARLSRACAADPSLVPVIQIPGVPPQLPAADAAGGRGFEMAIPPAFFVTKELNPSRNVVVLFTRSPTDVGNLDDFRCLFAGVPVPMPPDTGVDDAVVKPGNVRQLAEACRVTEARALQALQADRYALTNERSPAARTVTACREARGNLAVAFEAVRGLDGEELAKAPIRVALRRPGVDGEIVVIEPPEESSTPRPR